MISENKKESYYTLYSKGWWTPKPVSLNLSEAPYVFTAHMEIAWWLWPSPATRRRLAPCPSHVQHAGVSGAQGCGGGCWFQPAAGCADSEAWPWREASHCLRKVGHRVRKANKGWVREVRDQSHAECSGWSKWGTNIWSILPKMF